MADTYAVEACIDHQWEQIAGPYGFRLDAMKEAHAYRFLTGRDVRILAVDTPVEAH